MQPTTVSVDLFLPVASWRQRIRGYLVDAVVVLVPLWILVFKFFPSEAHDGSLMVLPVAFIYAWVQHALWGQTLGKRMYGTKVVRAEDHGPVGWRRAATRDALNHLSGLIPIAGIVFNAADGLWILKDDRNQSIHDKVARTVVVNLR